MRQRIAISVGFGLAALALHALWANATPSSRQAATHLASYRWQIPEGWFGGFSGLIISEDGTNLLAVSDRGQFVQAALLREDSQIADVTNVRRAQVLRKNGQFAPRPIGRDTEGLALMPNGALMVSFEGQHRVERFSRPGAIPRAVAWHADFDQMPKNAGFEAIATAADGTVYAMPEAPIGAENVVQVFALKGGAWRKAFTLNRDKQFQPVGADIGPDGRLYILERGFNGFGFRTRARSFDISGMRASDEKLLFQKGIGRHDNLEGLSVWRDDQARIRLTMISDDNFRLIQRTEIVEYVIAP